MAVGITLLVVGLIAVLTGGTMTRRAVKRRFGEVSEETMYAAQGTGINPPLAPILVLGGWLIAAVGVVLWIAL